MPAWCLLFVAFFARLFWVCCVHGIHLECIHSLPANTYLMDNAEKQAKCLNILSYLNFVTVTQSSSHSWKPWFLNPGPVAIDCSLPLVETLTITPASCHTHFFVNLMREGCNFAPMLSLGPPGRGPWIICFRQLTLRNSLSDREAKDSENDQAY